MSNEPTVSLPDEGVLGPAMRALPTDRMRLFVVAMHELAARGENSMAEAAKAAGYGTPTTTLNAYQVTGHRLAHDERVQLAMREEGERRLGALVPIGTGILAKMARDDDLKPNIRLKAIGMILNRAGLPEVSEHRVKTERVLSDTEKVDKIIDIANKLGLDPRKLLGEAGHSIPARLERKVVDAEA